MGKPVRIVELARRMVSLSGLTVRDEETPDGDIEIRFTGLRPAEKLFEELSYKGENILPTTHPKILRFASHPRPLEQLQQELQALFANVQDIDPNELKLALKRLIPEYRPYLNQPTAPASAIASARPIVSRT
jgi:FlaA1/EpsC-like NDP-sugar epimerase